MHCYKVVLSSYYDNYTYILIECVEISRARMQILSLPLERDEAPYFFVYSRFCIIGKNIFMDLIMYSLWNQIHYNTKKLC